MTRSAGGRPVVAAIDGSEGSLRGAHLAAGEARLRDAPLELVTALPWPSLGLVGPRPPETDVAATLLTDAESVLQSVAAEVAPVLGNDRVTYRVVQRTAADGFRRL
jgi:nucleotide-binding universal stress UspA family protein